MLLLLLCAWLPACLATSAEGLPRQQVRQPGFRGLSSAEGLQGLRGLGSAEGLPASQGQGWAAGPHQVFTALPTCRAILLNLTWGEAELYRDWTQALGYHIRKREVSVMWGQEWRSVHVKGGVVPGGAVCVCNCACMRACIHMCVRACEGGGWGEGGCVHVHVSARVSVRVQG